MKEYLLSFVVRFENQLFLSRLKLHRNGFMKMDSQAINGQNKNVSKVVKNMIWDLNVFSDGFSRFLLKTLNQCRIHT